MFDTWNIFEDVKVYFKSKKELDKYTSKDQLMHNGYVAEIEHLDQPDLKQFIKWWRGKDSNFRRPKSTGLQPAPFDRSGTPPLGKCPLVQ